MNRIAAVTLALLVLAGSVPAAAAFAGGAQTTDTGGSEPGAVFAGVVGVQGAEVDNEIDRRAFAQQFAAASSNDSKAEVVADQSRQLRERLDELEAKKARLERAHENGSIGEGEYRARLAELAAQIRAVEHQANRTATNAASLPEPALREHGANVSEVRSIARQANRTGGGEVAEAARQIAGEGVGNGLGPPEHAGPPDDAGSPANAGPPNESGPPGNNETGPPGDNEAGPPGEGDEPGPPEGENGTENGSNAGNATGGPPSDGGAETGPNGGNETGSDGNAPDGSTGDARDARERDGGNDSAEDAGDRNAEADSDETDGDEGGGEETETVTPTATP